MGIHTHGNADASNGGVSMIALFKASHVIRDIVLKDAGLYDKYHDASEFIKGFLLGALAAGGMTGLCSAFQDKWSTSRKVLTSTCVGLVGGVVVGAITDKMHKDNVVQELSEKLQYDGLNLGT